MAKKNGFFVEMVKKTVGYREMLAHSGINVYTIHTAENRIDCEKSPRKRDAPWGTLMPVEFDAVIYQI